MEADSVIIELTAKTDQFDANIKKSAATFDQGVKQIGVAADNVEKHVGRMTLAANNNRIAMLEMGHVARGVGEQFAAGTPLLQIFGQHIAQVGEAAALSGSSLGKIGTFLGGPWGIAVTLATVVLTKLILAHKSEGDEVEALVAKLKKHAEQTHNNELADIAWKNTIDGLTDAIRKRREEQEKAIQTDAVQERQSLRQAQQEADAAVRQRDAIQKLIDAKKAEIAQQEAAIAAPGAFAASPQAGAALAVQLANLRTELKDLQDQLDKANKAIVAAKVNVTGAQVPISERLASYAVDEAKRINDLYDAMKQGAELAARGNDKLTASLTQTLINIEKLRKADLDAAAARKKLTEAEEISRFKQGVIGVEGTGPNLLGSSAEGFGQFMPKTWLAEFNQIFPQFRGLSDQAKLALRDNKQVAEAVIDHSARVNAEFLKGLKETVTAGNLYLVHLLGQPTAKKVLTAAANTPIEDVTTAAERAKNPIIANAGTAGGLIAAAARRFGDTSGAQSQGLLAINKALEDEKKAEIEQLKTFLSEKGKLDEDELKARQELTNDANKIDELEKKSIEIARKKYGDNIDALVEQKKLLPEQGKELKRINDELAGLRQELVDRRAAEREARIREADANRATELATSQIDTQRELLQSQEQLATTAKERHEIERKILDLQFQEEKLRLENTIALAQQVQLNKDAIYSEQQIKDAAAAEAKARGELATLPQRQANAQAQNDKSNAGPLKNYLDSIPSTADEINQALENIAVGGLQSFSQGIADAIVNFHSLGDVARQVLAQITAQLIQMAIQQLVLKAFGAALGFGGGNAYGVATSGDVGIYAGGGPIFGPGTNTSDSIPIMASDGEFMIRASAHRRYGTRFLDAINNERLPHFAGGGSIRAVSPMNIAAVAPYSQSHGLSQQDIAHLRSIVNDAIRAVPDVHLHPVVDSAEVLKRGLRSTRGSREFLAYVSDNPGAVKASLSR